MTPRRIPLDDLTPEERCRVVAGWSTRRRVDTLQLALVAAACAVSILVVSLLGWWYTSRSNDAQDRISHAACVERRHLQVGHNQLVRSTRSFILDAARARDELGHLATAEAGEARVNAESAARYRRLATEIHEVTLSACR